MGYTTQGYRWVILKSRTHLLGWFRYYPGVFAQISTLSWPCRLRICQRTHRTHMLLQSQNLKPNRPPFPSVSHQSLFFSSFFFFAFQTEAYCSQQPWVPEGRSLLEVVCGVWMDGEVAFPKAIDEAAFSKALACAAVDFADAEDEVPGMKRRNLMEIWKYMVNMWLIYVNIWLRYG